MPDFKRVRVSSILRFGKKVDGLTDEMRVQHSLGDADVQTIIVKEQDVLEVVKRVHVLRIELVIGRLLRVGKYSRTFIERHFALSKLTPK